MMRNLVSLILVLFCVSFVVAQFQLGCFQVDLSSYNTSEACANVPRSSNFPTQTCDFRNPVPLNGTSGRCNSNTYNAIRAGVQSQCPAINYTEAYFCGDPPSELQSLPAFQYFSGFFSYCLLKSCADNSSCAPPPPSPPTAPTPPPPPPLCYDCCVFCYSGNETACQNSPGYNTTFRTRDADQTGCLSCSTAPPQSTPPPTSGTTTPSTPPPSTPGTPPTAPTAPTAPMTPTPTAPTPSAPRAPTRASSASSIGGSLVLGLVALGLVF